MCGRAGRLAAENGGFRSGQNGLDHAVFMPAIASLGVTSLGGLLALEEGDVRKKEVALKLVQRKLLWQAMQAGRG